MPQDVAWALSRVLVTVSGRTLSDLRGSAKPALMDQAPTRIMAGGKRAKGFNENPNANAVDYPFTIAAPSGDENFLDRLAADSAWVTLLVAYEDVTDIPDGACIGLNGRGKLSRADRQDGDEVGENAYVVHLIGCTWNYKNAPSITKI